MNKRKTTEAFVRASNSKHESTCRNCDPTFCTYGSHVLHASETNQCILEEPAQFCEALFHMFPCREFGLETHGCINGETKDNCRPQSLVLIAQLNDLTARYTNCRRQHAEQFMINDPVMTTRIQSAKPGDILTMYMKFQPCHHSSGNARVHPEGYLFKNKCDTRSCTELVKEFFLKELKPRGIALVIKCASIYKANWEYAVRPDDIATVANALDGVRELMRVGISLHSIQPADWVFLASLASNIQHVNLFSSARLTTDQGIAKFFAAQLKNL